MREESTYTARDWLASILHRKADGTVLDTLQYVYTDGAGVYDPTGHLRREVDGGGRTHAYSYSNLCELISESHPDLGTVSYTYDGNGNRTSRNQNGVLDYYGVDANNKLLWVNRGTNAAPTSGQANPYTLFSHDLNGRMTRRERKYSSTLTRVYDFLWDGDDRLKQVKEGTNSRLTASYDGGGLRVSKWDTWTGQHDFSWGPGGVLHDSSGSTTYTPGAAHRSNNVDRFYHTDWIGSSRYLSDSSGNNFPSALRYDAFGQRSATSGPDHPTDFLFAAAHGYQTEYQTGTEPGLGLQYLEQRWYDPTIGRFISADPIGFGGGLNLYGYGYNDPVNSVDPTGEQAQSEAEYWQSRGLPPPPPEGIGEVRRPPYVDIDNRAFMDFANRDHRTAGLWERWGRHVRPWWKTGTKPPLALPPARAPHGFANYEQFARLADSVKGAGGDRTAVVGVRGSAATGISHTRGVPFDQKSDIDFFIVSDTLFVEGLRRGGRESTKEPGTLHVGATLKFPGLRKIERTLRNELGRKVTVRIMSRQGYEALRKPTDVSRP